MCSWEYNQAAYKVSMLSPIASCRDLRKLYGRYRGQFLSNKPHGSGAALCMKPWEAVKLKLKSIWFNHTVETSVTKLHQIIFRTLVKCSVSLDNMWSVVLRVGLKIILTFVFVLKCEIVYSITIVPWSLIQDSYWSLDMNTVHRMSVWV